MDENTIILNLQRGSKGLGFNIIGGTDMASRSGDCGIFVSKIKDGGAAQVDGILEVGDRILEINSTKLENVQHAFAVQAFLDAGDDVRLIIQKKGPLRKKKGDLFKIGIPLVAAAVGIALVALLVVKNKK